MRDTQEESMLTINEYRKVESLEEAYELNQKKNNKIIAGGVWMKIGDRRIGTAIDLSGLGIDKITETDTGFVIGAMTTLRAIEKHAGLAAYTNGAIRDSVRHIVGVQFRNCATIGGSIFGRFGFSDVLTIFLAMDTQVELYQAGMVSLKDFIDLPYDNDILVALHVAKKPIRIAYLSQRNTATDFPVVACAVSEYDDSLHVSIGARPAHAKLIELPIGSGKPDGFGKQLTQGFEKDEELVKELAVWCADQFTYGSNRRAGADYRKHVSGVLIRRAVMSFKS